MKFLHSLGLEAFSQHLGSPVILGSNSLGMQDKMQDAQLSLNCSHPVPILKKKIIHCLSEIQIQLGFLYFYLQNPATIPLLASLFSLHLIHLMRA